MWQVIDSRRFCKRAVANSILQCYNFNAKLVDIQALCNKIPQNANYVVLSAFFVLFFVNIRCSSVYWLIDNIEISLLFPESAFLPERSATTISLYSWPPRKKKQHLTMPGFLDRYFIFRRKETWKSNCYPCFCVFAWFFPWYRRRLWRQKNL